MDKWWKYVERACIFGGVLIGLGALYFEAGNYYGWNRTQPVPQTAGPIMALGSVWPIALAAISAALIFTGWGMIYARARRPKRANAALVKSLSVAEQQFNLAIRTFVLSKLDAAVKGYMGVFHEFINRYMAEDDARKLSDRQWAGLSQFSQVAVAMSLTANFEQLRAMFSDPEGQIDAASAQAAIDRFLNIYSGTKQHMLLLLPQISGARFNDHNLQIWHQAEALHGRHPRLGCVSHRRGKIPSGSGLPLGNNHEKLTPLTAGTNIPLKQILGLQRPAMARPKISGFLRPQR